MAFPLTTQSPSTHMSINSPWRRATYNLHKNRVVVVPTATRVYSGAPTRHSPVFNSSSWAPSSPNWVVQYGPSSPVGFHLIPSAFSRSFQCTHCFKSFRQRAHLKAHSRIHTGERPFSCLTCAKKFAEKSTLTRHARVHSGEKPYVCSFKGCLKSFANREPLRRHLRTHTGERPYPCPICHKAFAQSTHRLVHMRSHSGERPFMCPVCMRAFAHKSHVKRHVLAVHTKKAVHTTKSNVCHNDDVSSSPDTNSYSVPTVTLPPIKSDVMSTTLFSRHNTRYVDIA